MAGAVEELIAARVGGQFTAQDRSVTVGVAATRVLGNDAERVSYLVVNTGAVEALLGFDEELAAATTIPLAADGGSLSVWWEEDFVLPTYALNARVGAGSTTLLVIELRRTSPPRGG